MTTPPPWLSKLRGVQHTSTGWVAFCPAHDDREKRSLSIGERQGGWLVHCFVGCGAGQVMRTLGETEASLFRRASNSQGESRIIATYDYTDAEGALLYQIVRYEPKSFRARRPDGKGGWIGSLGECPRVLYRLPDLAEAVRVTWCEGEKDVETVRELGIVATTACAGSSAWRESYADDLARLGVCELVVLPDHDAAGEQYAATVAAACRARGLRVKIVRLPGLLARGDVSDWFASGHGVEEYRQVVDEVPWSEAGEMGPPSGRVHLATVLDQVLADIEAGHHEVVATMLPTLDRMLGGGFEPGNLVYLGGRPGIGKTGLALQWAREIAGAGHSVLVVSLEMALLALGRRVLAQAAGVDSLDLKTGRLGDGDWYAVRTALPKLRTFPIWFADQALSMDDVTALVSGFAESPPLGLLIVDYLQLVHAPLEIRDHRQQIEHTSKALKALARHARIPILCWSSLSRAPQGQRDRRPMMADLRESGELEHDGDIVLFLHAQDPMGAERELIVAKSRDGAAGILTLRFTGPILRFQEVSRREEGYDPSRSD